MSTVTQEPVLLWDLPKEEHPAYVNAGCGEETYEQYSFMLEREREYARTVGRQVVLMRLTVADILAELKRIGLPCTPSAVSLALRVIFERRTKDFRPA